MKPCPVCGARPACIVHTTGQPKSYVMCNDCLHKRIKASRRSVMAAELEAMQHMATKGRGSNMKINDALGAAIDNHDGILAGKVVDVLRFRFGMNYHEILARAQRLRPDLTHAAWETLMGMADVQVDR